MRAYRSHFNFQGHHPKVRPWNRHADYGVSIKVARLLSPKVMLLCASEEKLLEMMVVEMGCSDSGMWYVDTAGCGRLQANDAEPPPHRGWLRKAMQCAAVFLLGLMLLAGPTSCKKDPQPSPTPTPNTPTDTITPVVPGDTITPVTPGDTIQPGGDTIVPGGGKVVKFYYEGGDFFVPFDTLQRYQDDPAYDTIYLAIRLVCGDYWTPDSYTIMCDSLRPRFSRFSKLHGRLGIRPYQILPNADSMNMHVKGIAEYHKNYLLSKGYYVRPVVGKNDSKATQPQIYKGTMALPKNNCRGGRVRGR